MTTRAVRLMRELAARNVAITVQGSRMRFSPRSALDPTLIDRIVACRAEILALLGPDGEALPQLPGGIQRWLLHTIAEAPRPLPAALLHRRLDQAIGLLVRRGELQIGKDGALTLRAT
jgi:hypothetical protein